MARKTKAGALALVGQTKPAPDYLPRADKYCSQWGNLTGFEPWELNQMEDAPEVGFVAPLCQVLRRHVTESPEVIESLKSDKERLEQEVRLLEEQKARLKDEIATDLGDLKKMVKAHGRELVGKIESLESRFPMPPELAPS